MFEFLIIFMAIDSNNNFCYAKKVLQKLLWHAHSISKHLDNSVIKTYCLRISAAAYKN